MALTLTISHATKPDASVTNLLQYQMVTGRWLRHVLHRATFESWVILAGFTQSLAGAKGTVKERCTWYACRVRKTYPIKALG
jgi:hypothetical protein